MKPYPITCHRCGQHGLAPLGDGTLPAGWAWGQLTIAVEGPLASMPSHPHQAPVRAYCPRCVEYVAMAMEGLL
jgi:hypothetical protein